MKQKSLGIIAISVVAIVTVIFLNMPLRSTSINPQAALLDVTVTTDPPGCFVQLQNGVSDIMGVTHWTNWGSVTTDATTGIGVINTNNQGGSFKIIVSKTDYPTKEFSVPVSGTTASVKAIIRPLYTLTVQTNPNPSYVAGRLNADGFSVSLSLNGQWLSTITPNLAGVAVYTNLDLGTYKIEVWKGGGPKVTLVKTLTGSANVIMLFPELTPSLRTLTVVTVPTGCNVTLVGKGSQTSTSGSVVFSSLPLDTYTLIVTKTGYYPSTTGVTIGTSDRTVTVSLIIIKYDLIIQTFPTGCTVTLSGVATKTSDASTGQVTFESLSPGTYTLTVSKLQYDTQSKTITIGQDTVVNIALSPIEGPGAPVQPIPPAPTTNYTPFILIGVVAIVIIAVFMSRRKKRG